ncbi:MAG: GNAT family N-acetyltransferase [Candidatus Hodarchaeota archaeon]
MSKTWDEVAGKHASYRPFLSFDWFRLWLEHFLDDHQLLILLLYKHDNLRTIAPLFIKQQRLKGIRVRKVQFIGNVYSPIQTFIFKDIDIKEREEQIGLILQYFSRISNHWDLIDLQSIPEEDDTIQILSNAIKKSEFKSKESFCFGNWYLDGIEYSSDIYFKNRSRNLRASIKKNYKNAEKFGKLEFKMITSATNIDKYMKIYFEVYAKSWKKPERFGPNFFKDFTNEAAQKGWLRLGIVFLNKLPIAAGFAIVCNGFAYLEKTGYDDRYKELGAGSIWLTEMIKYVIDVDHVAVIDVLRGDEEYKKRWMSKRRERKDIVIFNNNLNGSLFHFLLNRLSPIFNQNKYLSAIKAFTLRKFLTSNST